MPGQSWERPNYLAPLLMMNEDIYHVLSDIAISLDPKKDDWLLLCDRTVQTSSGSEQIGAFYSPSGKVLAIRALSVSQAPYIKTGLDMPCWTVRDRNEALRKAHEWLREGEKEEQQIETGGIPPKNEP